MIAALFSQKLQTVELVKARWLSQSDLPWRALLLRGHACAPGSQSRSSWGAAQTFRAGGGHEKDKRRLNPQVLKEKGIKKKLTKGV